MLTPDKPSFDQIKEYWNNPLPPTPSTPTAPIEPVIPGIVQRSIEDLQKQDDKPPPPPLKGRVSSNPDLRADTPRTAENNALKEKLKMKQLQRTQTLLKLDQTSKKNIRFLSDGLAKPLHTLTGSEKTEAEIALRSARRKQSEPEILVFKEVFEEPASPEQGAEIPGDLSLEDINKTNKVRPLTVHLPPFEAILRSVRKGKFTEKAYDKTVVAVAESLTAQSLTYLQRISPEKILPEKGSNDPDLKNAIKQTNSLVHTVVHALMKSKNKKELSRQYAFFVHVAHAAMKNGDFHTAGTIVSALNHNSIDRIPIEKENNILQMKQELDEINDNRKNYEKLFAKVKNLPSFVRPILPLNLVKMRLEFFKLSDEGGKKNVNEFVNNLIQDVRARELNLAQADNLYIDSALSQQPDPGKLWEFSTKYRPSKIPAPEEF